MERCCTCKSQVDRKECYPLTVYRKGIKFVYFRCRDCNTKLIKKYRNTTKGRFIYSEQQKRKREEYRVKHSARQKLNSALRKNLLIKPDICSTCKEKKKLDAHHGDYTQPLIVEWLCRLCHIRLHKTMVK